MSTPTVKELAAECAAAEAAYLAAQQAQLDYEAELPALRRLKDETSEAWHRRVRAQEAYLATAAQVAGNPGQDGG